MPPRVSRTKGKRVVMDQYALRACNQCKKAHKKCKGNEPICQRCSETGHECVWGTESARKAITKNHEQSLKNRVAALEGYVRVLQARLRDQGDAASGPSQPQLSVTGAPQTADDWRARLDPASVSDSEDLSDETSDAGSEIEKLCAPSKNLILEYDDLQLYGLTSVFRLTKPPSLQSFRHPRTSETTSSKKHVLLLSDATADTSEMPQCECWSHCWSRHLPPFSEVPLNRKEHDRLLSLIFKFLTSWCMRIIPELFLRDMYRVLHTPASQPVPKTAHYSPCLHNSLLAVATAYSDDPLIFNMETRQRFAEKAKSYIESDCERPSLSAVQALSILATYYSGQGLQTLGFMYFGMSSRIGQALGLGADCSRWVKAGYITFQDMFERSWCFQMNCAQDACWSLYVGREFGTPCPDYDAHLSTHPFGRELDQTPFEWAPSGLPSQPSYLFATFMATCELTTISRRVMDVIVTIRNGLSGAHGQVKVNLLVAEIDVQLMRWKERLPQELDLTSSNDMTATPNKLMLHLAYWWLLILLHRPFYRRQRVTGIDLPFSVRRCNLAAKEIMNIVSTWRTLYTLRYTPITFIQTAFSAGTVYLLTAVQANMGTKPAPVKRSVALENVRFFVDALREVGRSWQSASKIADIFDDLLLEQEQVPEGAAAMTKAQLRKRKVAVGSSSCQTTPCELSSAQLPGSDQPHVTHAPERVTDTSVPTVASTSGALANLRDCPPQSDRIEDPLLTPLHNVQVEHMEVDYDGLHDISMEEVFAMCGMGLGMVDGDMLATQPYALVPQVPLGLYQEFECTNNDAAFFDLA